MEKVFYNFICLILFSCNAEHKTFPEQYWYSNKEKLLTLPSNIYFSIIPIESATKYRITIQEHGKDYKYYFVYSLRTGDSLMYQSYFNDSKISHYFLKNRLTFDKYIQSVVKYYEQFSLYYIERSQKFVRYGFINDVDIIVCTDPKLDLDVLNSSYKHHPFPIEKGVYFYQRPFDYLKELE